jgi:CRP-like cAMP-binding protein
MDLPTFLLHSPDVHDRTSAAQFALNWAPKHVSKGASLASQGEVEPNEIILLDGCLASRIYDPNGQAVCVGLYKGPCVVTPNIARTGDGVSLVSLEALTDCLAMQMDSNALTELMIASSQVRDWANGVLRTELARRADREWCLAALGGADRLRWFREKYSGYEDIFPHTLIASFLGMTPVTLSRLRNREA